MSCKCEATIAEEEEHEEQRQSDKLNLARLYSPGVLPMAHEGRRLMTISTSATKQVVNKCRASRPTSAVSAMSGVIVTVDVAAVFWRPTEESACEGNIAQPLIRQMRRVGTEAWHWLLHP